MRVVVTTTCAKLGIFPRYPDNFSLHFSKKSHRIDVNQTLVSRPYTFL